MILWTPQPLELVFDSQSEKGSNQAPFEMSYKGRTVLVEHLGDKKKIVQLISTDPQDYLLEEFQPGTVLNI